MVSNTTLMILVFIALAICIFVGIKKDCNIGILGILMALIIGSWLGGATLMQVIGYWPVNIMFIIMVTSIFFGYANENGTLAAIADRIVYKSKSVRWFAPFTVYLAALIISAVGVGTLAIVFVAPIGFVIAKRAKFDPILVPIAANCAALSAGGLIWTAGGPTNIGLLMNAGWSEQSANALAIKFGFASLPPCLIAFLICYFLCKGWKCEQVIMEKPAPMNRKQRDTLLVIVIVMLMNIIPLFLNMIFKTKTTAFISNHVNLQICAVIGAIICMLLNLGDEREVITKHVPWYSLIIICGMSMLMKVAVQAGIADLIGSWMNSAIPAWALTACFALFGGLLSFFASALSVVYPLMLPMIYGLIQNGSSASTLGMVTSLILTACYTGMCPFSQNGALMLSSADAETRHALTFRMINWSFVLLAISIVYALIGGYDIFG